MQIETEFVYPAAAPLGAILGSAFDVKSRRVPNLITGPAPLAGVLLHLAPAMLSIASGRKGIDN
jgi:prepilin peptidase CpaA